jgi:hypothetical protein
MLRMPVARRLEFNGSDLHRVQQDIGRFRQRKTVLFVTHSIEEALKLGDVILVMTERPGCAKQIFHLDIPQPRDVASDPAIIDLNIEIRRLLYRGDREERSGGASVRRSGGALLRPGHMSGSGEVKLSQ